MDNELKCKIDKIKNNPSIVIANKNKSYLMYSPRIAGGVLYEGSLHINLYNIDYFFFKFLLIYKFLPYNYCLEKLEKMGYTNDRLSLYIKSGIICCYHYSMGDFLVPSKTLYDFMGMEYPRLIEPKWNTLEHTLCKASLHFAIANQDPDYKQFIPEDPIEEEWQGLSTETWDTGVLDFLNLDRPKFDKRIRVIDEGEMSQWTDQGQRPDLIVPDKNENKSIAVECEITPKQQENYDTNIAAYKNSQFCKVIWVCASSTIYEKIIQALDKCGGTGTTKTEVILLPNWYRRDF